jgi:hypothetical protein
MIIFSLVELHLLFPSRTPSNMGNDVKSPLGALQSLKEDSIVSNLLKIQNLVVDATKAVSWAENLKCLSISSYDDTILELSTKPSHGLDATNYIAVSHAWSYSRKSDQSLTGRYRARIAGRTRFRRCKVRDEVLDRVIAYAKHFKVSRFWLDIECIDQNDPSKRQVAMDSMDLVYSCSSHPLGLLSTVLETQQEVNMLQDLLFGKFTKCLDPEAYPRLAEKLTKTACTNVIAMLVHLSSDQWWHRGWIFQEEYRSSVDMQLLIQHRLSIKKRREFGCIRGEMRISTVRLRTEATRFLLAYQSQARSEWGQVCEDLLQTLSQYNILYRFCKSANAKAMSSRIIADIGRRQVHNAFDLLPSIANSCDYRYHLHSKQLASRDSSLSLCLLALFLLNGEIFRNGIRTASVLERTNIFEYLDYISFRSFRPPVMRKELTFLKRARFPHVSFSEQGVCTTGHLWEICSTLDTGRRRDIRYSEYQRVVGGLNAFQYRCLHWLLGVLQNKGSAYKVLINRVLNFIARATSPGSQTEADKLMLLMAEQVVEAIRTRKVLYFAQLVGSSHATAIFVNVGRATSHVFTSWHSRDLSYDRTQDFYVSIRVEVVNEDCKRPVLRAQQWINGLAIFKQVDKIQAVFAWPLSWMNK